jgi:RNA polymerase sigma-70 factor (ECF subfamily)
LKVPELDKLLTDIYNDTYNDVLKYVIIKCRNADDIPDLMQNIYLNLYNRLKKHGRVNEPKKYLIKIAKHELYRHYGFLNLSKNLIPVFSPNAEENFSNFETELMEEDVTEDLLLCKDLWLYIKKCDILTFKIFSLYFSKDLKISDIAKALKVKESTVKNRLYRTLKEMKKEFEI